MLSNVSSFGRVTNVLPYKMDVFEIARENWGISFKVTAINLLTISVNTAVKFASSGMHASRLGAQILIGLFLRASAVTLEHWSTGNNPYGLRDDIVRFLGMSLNHPLTSNITSKTCKFVKIITKKDCLCGQVVRVSGYRSRDPGSISVATRFSEH
jgi:hypothetical protein